MKHLNNASLKLMPKALVFVQESGKLSGMEERNLDRLFQVIRSRPDIVASHRVVYEKKAPIAHAAHEKKNTLIMTLMIATVLSGWMWPKM